MTEIRRLKMKFGDAEFEADVPDRRVQPMYYQFLSVLERRRQTLLSPFGSGAEAYDKTSDIETNFPITAAESFYETLDQTSLMRIFDLRDDGSVILKMHPKGPDKDADALLLLLYGYSRLKNEKYVLVTHLRRAARQSGISMRYPAYEFARNGRFMMRAGQRKGSNYSLNSQGLAMARQIAAKILG
jgi:hypothetical protein